MYIITDYRVFNCLGMTYFLSIYEGNDAAAASLICSESRRNDTGTLKVAVGVMVVSEGDYSMPAAVSRASRVSILAMASLRAAVNTGINREFSIT